MMKYRLLLLTGLLLAVSTVQADLSILPFSKGSFAEIKNQRQGKPFIVIFWSESCAYCMQELALFGALQSQYSHVELITVATDVFLDDQVVKEVLSRSQLDLNQTWVFAEQFPERIYTDVNKRWRGELPVTHFFDGKNQEIRHLGIVKKDILIAWLSAQLPLGGER